MRGLCRLRFDASSCTSPTDALCTLMAAKFSPAAAAVAAASDVDYWCMEWFGVDDVAPFTAAAVRNRAVTS